MPPRVETYRIMYLFILSTCCCEYLFALFVIVVSHLKMRERIFNKTQEYDR